MSEHINGMTYDEFIDAVVHRVFEMQAKEEYSVFKKMLEACDTVQVVRCHDCEHYCKNDLCKEGNEFEQELWRRVEPNGFCAWGVRK